MMARSAVAVIEKVPVAFFIELTMRGTGTQAYPVFSVDRLQSSQADNAWRIALMRTYPTMIQARVWHRCHGLLK